MTAPLILTATFGDGDNGWLQELRRTHFPPARNQVPAHMTLFHQLPPSMEAELSHRIGGLAALPAPQVMITGVMDLGRGTALRVESADLAAMRAELADAMHGMLIPQDLAPWRGHITIQNKVEAKDAKALQQQMRATFAPRPLAVKGLALWRYLDGPWEPVKNWTFRG